MQTAQAARMALGDRAFAVMAVHQSKTEVQQLVHRPRRLARARPDPQHRPFRRQHPRRQLIHLHPTRLSAGGQGQHEIVQHRGTGDLLALQVDRDFHTHRPGRRGQRIRCRARQDAQRVLRRADAPGGFGNGPQHAELVDGVVDGAHFAVGVAGGRHTGEVQDGGAGETRLDQSADRVGRAGAGGGEDHAQTARHARVAVGHMHAAHFAARHHEADGVAPADRVQHGNIVHGGDAEGGGDAAGGQELGNQIADGVVAGHS